MDTIASQPLAMEIEDASQLMPPPPPKVKPPQRLRNKPSSISIDSGYESNDFHEEDIESIELQYSTQERPPWDCLEPALAHSQLDHLKSVLQRLWPHGRNSVRCRAQLRSFRVVKRRRRTMAINKLALRTSLVVERQNFYRSGNYINHYSCPLCPRKYFTARHLRTHVWAHTHTLDEWYECRTCYMSFATCFDVVRHLLLHQSLTYSIRRLWPSYTRRNISAKCNKSLDEETEDTGTSSFGIFGSCATILHAKQSIAEYTKWCAQVCAARLTRSGITSCGVWEGESEPDDTDMNSDQHCHGTVTKLEAGTKDVEDTSLGDPLGNTISSLGSPPTRNDSDVQETDITASTWASSPETTESVASPWPDSPTSVEQDSLIRPALDASRQLLVDRLMVDVHALLSRNLGARSRTSSSQPSNNTENSQSGLTSGQYAGGYQRKRGRDDEEDGERHDYGSDDGEAHGKRYRGSAEGNKRRKLACPFYQRDPTAHQQIRSCAGPGWDQCRRVKEHLYRRHMLPAHRCPRCSTAFKSMKELLNHAKQAESCVASHSGPPIGLDHEQEKKLRTKKKLSGTEEQRWVDMYRICFPDDSDELTPSPYYEDTRERANSSDQLAEYDRYMARELPRIVRSRLEASVQGAAEPLLSQLRSQLVDIVRDCQAELYRAYKKPANEQKFREHAESPPTLPTKDPETSNPLLFDPNAGVPDISAFYVPPAISDPEQDAVWQTFGSTWLERTPPEDLNPSSDSGFASFDSLIFKEMCRAGTSVGVEDAWNNITPEGGTK